MPALYGIGSWVFYFFYILALTLAMRFTICNMPYRSQFYYQRISLSI